MTQSPDTFLQELMTYLHHSPTPFHAVSNAVSLLEAAGYQELAEGAAWDIKPDGRYLVRRNGSALVAFNGACVREAMTRGIRLFGAHSDSPCLKVKPIPEIARGGYWQLGVETYGGVLLAPWFDRDLSLAGRVVFQTADGQMQSRLLDWKHPLALIPNLAIHLDREANNGRAINPQTQLPAILMKAPSATVEFRALIQERLKQEHGIDAAKVLDFELSFYDAQPPARVGLRGEFLASARLDNLLSCFIGVAALRSRQSEEPVILVLNDHEEVGSASAEGASGPFLRSILRRVVSDREEDLARCLSRSFLISADNAHAVHPNFADRHDDKHGPVINAGPVIKVNSNQRYATNSLSASFYRHLSESLDCPVQVFVTRSDMACGSTIGPLTASELGVRTLDIGVPQWAMHSIRESCGVEDPFTLYRVTTAFFDCSELPQG